MILLLNTHVINMVISYDFRGFMVFPKVPVIIIFLFDENNML